MENNSTENKELKTLDDIAEKVMTGKFVADSVYKDGMYVQSQDVEQATEIILDAIKKKFNIKNEKYMKLEKRTYIFSGYFRHNFKLYSFVVEYRSGPGVKLELIIRPECNRKCSIIYRRYNSGSKKLILPISNSMFDNIKLPVDAPKFMPGDNVILTGNYVDRHTTRRYRWGASSAIKDMAHRVGKVLKISRERWSKKFVYHTDLDKYVDRSKLSEYYRDDEYNKYYGAQLKKIAGGA